MRRAMFGKDYLSFLTIPDRHTLNRTPMRACKRNACGRNMPCVTGGRRSSRRIKLRSFVMVLICCVSACGLTFAACPTHTGEPPADADHFDLQHYATGDWFGLRNTLYDYGIEITGGYTMEPAGNPVGGLEQGFTYLHNFG